MGGINTVVEWGAGYGNFTKLLTRLIGRTGTYILIDSPLISTIQWLYLSTVFGEEKLNFVKKPHSNIEAGKINIVPVGFLDDMDINTDLFVSTWALSESSEYSQRYVASKNWFHAKHLLLAYAESTEQFPLSDLVGEIAKKQGATIEKIDCIKESYYAFL